MCSHSSLREELIRLAGSIRDARDRGLPDEDLLAAFERLLPGTDVDNLCHSDYDPETIADICLGEKESHRKLTSEELLQLVRNIFKPTETEAEKILMVMTFKNNCRHPAGSNLIFYPETLFENSNPTPEEIVEKAIHGQ